MSALIEARRFNAQYAMMIVHSFSPEHAWLEDYQAFLGLFGVSGQVGELVELQTPCDIRLFAGWVTSQARL